jgi:superfamily II DNA or RNA helicase
MTSDKTIQFLEKLKESGNYNNNYDYSKVNYVNNSTKIIIIDEYGFEHQMIPYSLLSGNKLTFRSVVNKNQYIKNDFNKIHGDKYDYSLVNCENNKKKINIICKKHGLFIQDVSNHLQGKGCPCCGKLKISTKLNLGLSKFINNAKKIHGDKYDYSKSNYKNSSSRILIIDEFGFEHQQRASYHLSGGNLSILSAVNKNEYIKKLFTDIHGDKYNYDKINYINNNSIIKIFCKEHKDFFYQKSAQHLSGAGCSFCNGGVNFTTSDFIKKSKEIHGEIFDYSKVDYVNSATPITIIKDGVEYSQIPMNHLKGFRVSKSGILDKLSNFIKEANEIHEDRYDYSLVEYSKSNQKVKIKCDIHGVFEQTPKSHLKGSNCPKCSGGVRKTNEFFIEQSNNLHNNIYDYSNVNYINAHTNVDIFCEIHGIFSQTPLSHLGGSGCPICNTGFTKKFKLRLLNELRETDLLNMDPFDLFIIIGQGKLPDDFKSISQTDANSEERLMSINDMRKKLEKEVILEENSLSEVSDENEVNNIDVNDEVNKDEKELSEIDDVDDEITENKTVLQLPKISNIDEFHSLDNKYYATMDEEAFSALILNKTQKLWNKVLNNIIKIEDIKKETGGKYFTIIKDSFLNEYNIVINYSVPDNYYSHVPNLMQKLTVTRLVNQKYLLNLSGTGAGKTISMILSSRTVNSKLSVIIALNSTIEQTSKEILKAFPDSLIFNEHKIGTIYDRSKYNYLVLNYEKFQLSYSEELYQDLTNNNIIEFVDFDELQNVKQRDDQESVRRGVLKRLMGRIREKNENLYTLGMSATPVINNLNEAKSLLEIVSGKEYEDLNTFKSISNALRIYQQFLINGIRYLPNYEIELDKKIIEIDGSDLTELILKLPKNNYIELEKLLLNKKLESIKDYLKPGVCIYTYYTTDFKNKIYDFVTKNGFTCVCYTGDEGDDRKENLDKFLNGKVDIIIGSKPITTGVDGLQNVCDTLIEITQPWTSSDEKQLHGRFIRQGSNFDKVTVIIPQVKIDIDGKTWSWDKQRTNLIENKKTLADLAVDGKIPSRILPSKETLYKKSIESLEIWKNRINIGDIIENKRKSIDINLYPELDSDSKRQRINSELSEFNRRGKTTLSSTMNKEFNINPESWFKYHSLRRESMKDWSEIPYEYIAKKIKNKNHKVADFGCGENLLKNFIPNEVISFDHVAIDESVISCDMSDVSKYLDNESIDVAVFSLALWGTNYKDYIKEAYRTLNWGGIIYISEPSKNYETEEEIEKLINLIKDFGFEIVGGVEKRNKFIYIRGIK